MKKSNEKLCEEIQNNSSSALLELINQNSKLIYSLMNRFYYKQSEKEDLFSCAKIGLIKASQNFKPSFNCVFTTYAVPLILGEIKKYFRNNYSLHVSRSYQDLYCLIVKAQEELETKTQKNISLKDISEYLKVSFVDVLIAYESHYSLTSIDSPLVDDDSLCLLDTLKCEENNDLSLKLALEKLTKREQMIIELRYYQGYTQEEVAKRLFISQVQISRLEKQILEKLRVLI